MAETFKNVLLQGGHFIYIRRVTLVIRAYRCMNQV